MIPDVRYCLALYKATLVPSVNGGTSFYCFTQAIMSTINRFLSRRDRHTHGSHKEKVMSPPESPSSSDSVEVSSLRPRRSTSSSLSSVSLAFPGLPRKRSPRRQANIGIVECSCTDLRTLLLQPKSDGGILNGMFVADQERKDHVKDEDRKARYAKEVMFYTRLTIS